MAKFTAKQIRRFYALRKAKVNSKLQEKLREDNANDVLKEILNDSSFFLGLTKSNFENDPSTSDNIELLIDGIENFLSKLESQEIKIIYSKK